MLSHVWLFATPWTAAHQASLSFTISQSLLNLMSFESVMPSNHLILYHPFSSCPQFFPASRSFPMIQLFTSGGQTIGASASSSVPSNDYSGLIPFRIDWFDLLAFQGILKSLLQHHSLNASILFFFFECINSLAPNLLYGPILTSVLNYWKNMTTGKKKHVAFV